MVKIGSKHKIQFSLSDLAVEVLGQHSNKSAFVNDAILRAHMEMLKKAANTSRSDHEPIV